MKFLGLNITKAKIEQPTTFESSRETFNYVGDIINAAFDGTKFPGSFGATKDYSWVDYYTLRKRSLQLYKENTYARGLFRRLLRNEINIGLNPEVDPIKEFTGQTEDEASAWSDTSEIDWKLWGDDPEQCDYRKKDTIGKLAESARLISMLTGDVVVVLRMNKKTGLPMVELVDGERVMNPFGKTHAPNGNKIKYGVELNSKGVHVAYWIKTLKNKEWKVVRVPCKGEKSGRRISWMIYGSEKRLDEVRGEPILAIVLYTLKELDRYKDAEQRAAVINGMLPLFIRKTEKGIGSQPFGAGAVKKDAIPVNGDNPPETRNFNSTHNLPGMVADELAFGEEPVSFNAQRPNVNYGKFEEIIINTFAWLYEVPPEIMRLLFQSNFSASRQANNEFNVYLQYRFKIFGDEFYQPIYKDRLLSAVLTGQLEAPGLLEAWRDPSQFRVVGAWTNCEWAGISRPSVDINKDVTAAEKGLKSGIGTYDFWNRRITGKSARTNMEIRRREQNLMEKLGLSFSAEENNNGEPIQGEEQNVVALEERVLEIEDKIEEMEEK